MLLEIPSLLPTWNHFVVSRIYVPNVILFGLVSHSKHTLLTELIINKKYLPHKPIYNGILHITPKRKDLMWQTKALHGSRRFWLPWRNAVGLFVFVWLLPTSLSIVQGDTRSKVTQLVAPSTTIQNSSLHCKRKQNYFTEWPAEILITGVGFLK